MTPNIGKTIRISYTLIGLILVVAPLMMPNFETWVKVGTLVVGLMALGTGATGW